MPVDIPRSPIGGLPVIDASGANLLQHCRWSCGYECFHGPANASGTQPTFADVMARAISRRTVLKGGATALGAVMIGTVARPGPTHAHSADPSMAASPAASGATAGALTFRPITIPGVEVDELIVADGYAAAPVLRWGDPLFGDSPAFDANALTADSQAKQFGYDCDFVAFVPDAGSETETTAGLLWVNHEYTNPEHMFAGYSADAPTQAQVDVELAAHGGSVVEIERAAEGGWTPRLDGRNRRITALTPMTLSGPAAGDALLQTSEDATGTSVLGMLNNCAGGVTPWGTVLTCEENFNQYFANLDAMEDGPVKGRHTRYGTAAEATERKWERFYPRFDLTTEPNEPFRYGWVVEIDPQDPSSTPRKRTALGRFKHEGATPTLAPDGRVVVYTGDDERFDYVYKFVSTATYAPGAAGSADLLDEGTLYVARFDEEGKGTWLPLVQGEGPLTAENGFASQAEVLIDTRGAADLLEPTRMDRPEDIERDPDTGTVYLVMTNNNRRGVGPNYGIDDANPRADNRFGHIIELNEDGNDAASTMFTWDIFMLCGDPADQTTYFGGVDKSRIVSPISSPDNLVFDHRGNLWIVTDGQPGSIERNDAVFAVAVEGDDRGVILPFLSVPAAAEATGPAFTPDGRTIFVAVQHPGEGGTFEAPMSRWPDFDDATPPRPSVIAAWRTAEGDPSIGV